MNAPADELAAHIALWSRACDDLDSLLGELSETDWAAATDCPGWSVQDVVAHLASIEHALNTGEQPSGIVPVEGRSLASSWTEAGVAERRGMPHTQVVEQWRAEVAARRAHLAAQPPTDPRAPAVNAPGGVPWDNRTLLRNRVLDVWVHEQDIRRAVGRPGGMDSPAGELVAGIFAAAVPYAVAKRAAAPAGTRVAVVVDGERRDVLVDDAGHGAFATTQDPADVTLDLNREAVTVLGAGRRAPDDLPPTAYAAIAGDPDLADRILRGLNVTP